MSEPPDPLEIPGHIMRFWHAMDASFERVHPTWWGAVVTDSRFPDIWDVNYARVDVGTEELRADEVDRELLPALSAAGASTHHVVMFQPGSTSRLIVELEGRGLNLGWDLVMELDRSSASIGGAEVAEVERVEELAPGGELWDGVKASLSLFGTRSSSATRQLLAIERDVMMPRGKRWFVVRDRAEAGAIVSIGALLMFGDFAYIDNIATFPHARRRGFARAVTSVIVGETRSAGALSTWLLAEPGERGAVAMYEGLGFVAVGRVASTRGSIEVGAPPWLPSLD